MARPLQQAAHAAATQRVGTVTRFSFGTTGKIMVGLGVASLALTACGGSNGGGDNTASPKPSGSVDPALAALVPAAIKSSGTITFGTDASYAPAEFVDTDGETVIGMDVDLGSAISAKLGLQADFQNSNFDSIIVGVVNGKYNAGMSAFTINEDRKKQVNMISYFNAGTAWATQAGNPKGINPDEACGKVIAVQKATVQADDIALRTEQCVLAGKPAIDIQTYTLQSEATTAVVSGKADAMLADSIVISYAVQQAGGKLEEVGELYDAAPYGIIVPLKETDFAKAIQGAVNALIADGTYQSILEKWNAANGAITTSEINPSVS